MSDLDELLNGGDVAEPVKALADERRKRQDYERQLRELQQAQKQQEIQEAGAVAEIEGKQAKTARDMAEAGKTQVETQREAYNLGLETALAE